MEDETKAEPKVDPIAELEAMKAVHGAVTGLEPDAQTRVLQWVVGALGLRPSVLSTGTGGKGTDTRTDRKPHHHGNSGQTGSAGSGSYTAFADLLGDAQPQTDAEKALVGGYWFQVVQGAEDFASQSVNDKLKDTGEAIGNITRAYERLKASKPQLVRQLQKAGKSQQARKKLKLTTAGIEAVERMLRDER